MNTHQAISANVTAIRFICAEKGKSVKETAKPTSRGNTRTNTAFPNAQAAEQRSELGHWEGDTVAGRKGGARFLTPVDRKSRFLLAAKVPNGTAEAVRDTLIRMFSALPAEKIRSITPDRGHEFANHSDVSDALCFQLRSSMLLSQGTILPIFYFFSIFLQNDAVSCGHFICRESVCGTPPTPSSLFFRFALPQLLT